MKTTTLFNGLIAIGIILITFSAFALLQDETMFKNTLGKLTYNYGHVNNNEASPIVETKKPYEKINASNIYRWDAKLYRSVSDSMYVNSDFYEWSVRGRPSLVMPHDKLYLPPPHS